MIASCKRILTFLAALAAGLLVMTAPTDVVEYSDRRTAVLVFIGALSLTLAIRLALSERALRWRLDRRPSFRPSMPPSPRQKAQAAIPASPEFVAYAKQIFRKRFVEETLDYLTPLLTDPALFVLRITEEVQVEDDKFCQRVTRTLLPPEEDAAGKPLLVPIMRARKGVLIDNLSVTISGGNQVSTLTQAESQGAVLSVVELIFRHAYPTELPRSLVDRRRLRDLLTYCGSPEPVDSSQLGEMRTLLEEFRVDYPLTRLPKNEREQILPFRVAFEQLVLYAAVSYFCIAVLPPTDAPRVRVTTEHTQMRRGRFDSWQNRMRVALGLSIRTYTLELPHALECPSYHCRMKLEEGLYAYSAGLLSIAVTNLDHLPITSFKARKSSEERPRFPKATMGDAVGRDFMHVYARDMDGADSRELSLDTTHETVEPLLTALVEARERPPGLLLTVLLLSGYLAILTWGVAHFHDRVFPAQAGVDLNIRNSSWPTILFSIPAIVSGWLVSRFTVDIMRRVSLSTISATAWLLLNAGAAVAIAAIKVSGDSASRLAVPGIQITHVAWAFLTLSTCVSFFLNLFMLVSRTIRYWRRASFSVSR